MLCPQLFLLTLSLSIVCLPSPCAWLSRALTTTKTPSLAAGFIGHRFRFAISFWDLAPAVRFPCSHVLLLNFSRWSSLPLVALEHQLRSSPDVRAPKNALVDLQQINPPNYRRTMTVSLTRTSDLIEASTKDFVVSP